jgi:glycosyltransferase involved in cell wall biosynthesis
MNTPAPETQANGIALSVIIPHYNCVAGLLRLLNTIPDVPWIEVLAVDDRSTCDITELKDYVSKRGGQIQLLVNDRPSKGAGTARNIGVENASGKWLLFADADDYFTDNWTDVVSEYLASDADIIYFPPTSRNIETGKLGARHRHYEELVKAYAAKSTRKAENELKYGFYTPWSKMIKRRLFTENDIRFEEQLVANDVMALTKCAYYSRKILADQRTIYCVTCGEKTLTSKKNDERFDTRIDTKIRRYVFLREHLSRKDFNQTHVDYYMAGSLADAALGKWGKDKFAEVLKKYKKNGVKWLTIYMFEPSFLFRYILLDFKWRLETNA